MSSTERLLKYLFLHREYCKLSCTLLMTWSARNTRFLSHFSAVLLIYRIIIVYIWSEAWILTTMSPLNYWICQKKKKKDYNHDNRNPCTTTSRVISYFSTLCYDMKEGVFLCTVIISASRFACYCQQLCCPRKLTLLAHNPHFRRFKQYILLSSVDSNYAILSLVVYFCRTLHIY